MKQFDIYPSPDGFFGSFGGQVIPDNLKVIFNQIAEFYFKIKDSPDFRKELGYYLSKYAGRPSPLYLARNLTAAAGGSRIYLKREDLNHTGAHKINHCLGEALLAKRMGKKKLIAETGAGQHGVAVATAAAVVGLPCEIYMGEIDIAKQKPNVLRMEMLGAKVNAIGFGGRSLKEAVDGALAAFLEDPENIFYAIGSVVGPHPFPMLVRDFQRVVGEEARSQILEETGSLPAALVACVGGGSNAIGLFSAFLEDESVAIYGIEPSGRGLQPGQHAATLTLGKPGEIHGMHTMVLQDSSGAPSAVHSIASGLDYPGVGPQLSFLKEAGRLQCETISDQECLEAFRRLSRTEGIIPALESAHAVAFAVKLAAKMPPEKAIIVNLSGRGDKDLEYVSQIGT
jgi:tryptophan synthase beta chain